MSKSGPPRWLVNWCALNDMMAVDADQYVVGHRGEWYIGKAPAPGHLFIHDSRGFYCWKRTTRRGFLASYVAQHPTEQYWAPQRAIGKPDRTIGHPNKSSRRI